MLSFSKHVVVWSCLHLPTAFPLAFHTPSLSKPGFQSRVSSSTHPTHLSFHSHLEKCSSMEELKQIHAQIIASGFLQEILTVGKLVAFCAVSSVGDLCYARAVFDWVPEPNRFMWNSLIRGYSNSNSPRESILLHRQMLASGLLPNHFTLPFVLKSCALESAYKEALLLHALIVKLGFASQVFVLNSLLHAYTVLGPIRLARQLFDEIPHKNVISWNTIISGYSKWGYCEEAFSIFKELRVMGLELDEFTLVSLLSVCSQTKSFELGKCLHHYIEITGAQIDVIVGNALVEMYGKCGELCSAQTCFDRMPERNVVTWTSMVGAHAKHGFLNLARSWFDQMPKRNIISWNSMISSYVQHGMCSEALDLYTHMRASKVEPDEATLIGILSACSQIGNLIMGKKIHNHILESNINPSITLCNSLVDMYAKCGPVESALQLFSTMPKKNVVSWNVMINAFAMHGRVLDAISLFAGMLSEGVPPDGITFVGILSACSHGGQLEVGQFYFEFMTHLHGIQPDIEHYACMIDLLGRAGHIDKAVQMISCMPLRPDIVIWGALLGACRIHSNVKITKQVVKQLLELEPYSGGLGVLAMNIYCEAQKWEDVKTFRKLMKDRGIRKGMAKSLIEINGEINEFIVADKRHENSSNIYLALDRLTVHLRSVGCLSDTSAAFLDIGLRGRFGVTDLFFKLL